MQLVRFSLSFTIDLHFKVDEKKFFLHNSLFHLRMMEASICTLSWKKEKRENDASHLVGRQSGVFYTATTHGLHKNAGDLWILTEIYVKMNSLEHFQQVQL